MEDELIDDNEDLQVRVFTGFLFIFRPCILLQKQPKDSVQARQLATAERKEKTKKRKAAEGQLQIKRQQMDKAKASSFRVFFSFKILHPLRSRTPSNVIHIC